MKRTLPLVFLLSCKGALLTGPSGLEEQTIAAEWAIAQAALECLGYAEAHSITPEMFEWVAHPTAFVCNDVEGANGCYTPYRRLIEWNTEQPHVIRHEAGHAILFELGEFKRYACFEHGDAKAYAWCPEDLLYPWQCKEDL